MSNAAPPPEPDAAMRSGETVELSEREEQEVRDRSAISAGVVFETVRRQGEAELGRPATALALSALAAGLSMGFSLVGAGVLRALLPDAPWRPLVANLGYTLGFLIVILGRQQLFTENTLTAILPLLDDKNKREKFVRVVRLWSIVLVGNVVGAAIFAFVVARAPVFSSAVQHAFGELGADAYAPSGGTLFIRAVFGGWLIATMVWLLPSAEASRPAIIGILTYVVGAAALAHVVAGSVEVLYLVAEGVVSPWGFVAHFFVPVFLGNSVGGVALVALLNYGQVAADG